MDIVEKSAGCEVFIFQTWNSTQEWLQNQMFKKNPTILVTLYA